MHAIHHRAGACAVLVTGLVIALAGASVQAESRQGRTLGFVMTSFDKLIYRGNDRTDCPSGFVQRGADALLAALSPPERARLTRPESAAELKELTGAVMLGVACLEPDWLPAKPHRVLQGQVAYGMDLDNGDTSDRAAPNTCPHRNFVGPNGEVGIDNQYYRAVGCMELRFRDGVRNMTSNGYMRDGMATHLIEVTGVDDMRNDDDVMVGLYAGADPMEVAAGDGSVVLPHVTLEIDPNPRFEAGRHVPVRGRIQNGILTTQEPIDFVLRVPETGEQIPQKFRGGRVRLELLPDGSAKGMIAAYQDMESAYREMTIQGLISTTEYLCPSFYRALKAMADGYPDPQTGECTALSTAYGFTAVPAFVIHPTPEQYAAATRAAEDIQYGWERMVEQRKGVNAGSDEFIQLMIRNRKLLEPLAARERARAMDNN